MWINSLGIDNGDLYINNLFADVQNGCAILKVSGVAWRDVRCGESETVDADQSIRDSFPPSSLPSSFYRT